LARLRLLFVLVLGVVRGGGRVINPLRILGHRATVEELLRGRKDRHVLRQRLPHDELVGTPLAFLLVLKVAIRHRGLHPPEGSRLVELQLLRDGRHGHAVRTPAVQLLHRCHGLANDVGNGGIYALLDERSDQIPHHRVVLAGRYDAPELVALATRLVQDRVRPH
jgi:hypothetical protein